MDANWDTRFTKAVLDLLGHQSPTMAMLRQEWMDDHSVEVADTDVNKPAEIPTSTLAEPTPIEEGDKVNE